MAILSGNISTDICYVFRREYILRHLSNECPNYAAAVFIDIGISMKLIKMQDTVLENYFKIQLISGCIFTG